MLDDLPLDRRRRERLLAQCPEVSAAVLQAIRDIPRHIFVDDRSLAYEDAPLAIGRGQTISQPSLVAKTLDALSLGPGMRVLDVGAGSGWTAALMARLVGPTGHVVALERHAPLCKRALANVTKVHDKALDAPIEVLHADGMQGYPKMAPYQAIHVGCAAKDVPQALLDELAEGGQLIIPVGTMGGLQSLQRITRKEKTFRNEILCEVRFVPMLPEVE
jgi:protein-L-isoaspartate(D-aspartate) O-methyltransferase